MLSIPSESRFILKSTLLSKSPRGSQFSVKQLLAQPPGATAYWFTIRPKLLESTKGQGKGKTQQMCWPRAASILYTKSKHIS